MAIETYIGIVQFWGNSEIGQLESQHYRGSDIHKRLWGLPVINDGELCTVPFLEKEHTTVVPIIRIGSIEGYGETAFSKLRCGFLDKENHFYEVPLSFWYVKVVGGEVKGHQIVLNLEVYSKSLKETKQLKLEGRAFNEGQYGGLLVDEYINSINLYIHSGRDLAKLNRLVTLDNANNTKERREKILKILSILKFNFFDCSQISNAAGKDNEFWKECEILGFEQNSLIGKLLVKSLEREYKYRVRYLRDNEPKNKIVVKYDEESAYAPAYGGRKEIDKDENICNELIEIFKFYFSVNFDYKEYMLESMSF